LSVLYRLSLHKALIQSLTFSFNERYLASLGGEDDKSNLIVWDVESGKPAFGSPLGSKTPIVQVKFFNTVEDKLIAVSTNGIQIITIDAAHKKVK